MLIDYMQISLSHSPIIAITHLMQKLASHLYTEITACDQSTNYQPIHAFTNTFQSYRGQIILFKATDVGCFEQYKCDSL